jgi:hypothetical protein
MGALMRSHMTRVKAALESWSGAGHYLNFAEEPVDVSLTHSTNTLARLRAVKGRIDPHNLIHANHAI